MKNFIYIYLFLVAITGLNAKEIRHIDNQQLKDYVQQSIAVVDVRTVTEWQDTDVIDGSHLIMFYDEQGKYKLKPWLTEIAKVANKNEPLILICHLGGRSNQLAKYLTRVEGYHQVYNLKHGIKHWTKQHNKIIQYQ